MNALLSRTWSATRSQPSHARSVPIAPPARIEALEQRVLFSAVDLPAGADVVDLVADHGIDNTGATDVTAAINAVFAANPLRTTFYLQDGTYKVSDTLDMRQLTGSGQDSGRFQTLQGESRDGVIIDLVDSSGLNGAVVTTGTLGSGDLFHNHVRNLTIDVGNNNPDADGLLFFANNMGSIRDVKIVSQDGQGNAGLDVFRVNNGPLFIEDVEIDGFDVGLLAGDRLFSQTIDGLTLRNQNDYGVYNSGQTLTISNLDFEGDAVAIHNGFVPGQPGRIEFAADSRLTLIDSTLTYTGTATDMTAIENRSLGLFVRDVTTTGWDLSIDNQQEATLGLLDDVDVAVIDEYISGPTLSLFESPINSLNIAVPSLDSIPLDYSPAADWVSVGDFGADSSDSLDDSAAIQAAIDSLKPGGTNYGKDTIYFPLSVGSTRYIIDDWVDVSGPVDHIIGLHSFLQGDAGLRVIDEPGVEDAANVVLERLSAPFSGTDISIRVESDMKDVRISSSAGLPITVDGEATVLIDDVVADRLNIVESGAEVYAWQLNTEGDETAPKVLNDGGTLVVHGHKTERKGTIIETRNGGTTEVIGAYYIPSQDARDTTMLVVDEADFFGANVRQFNNTSPVNFYTEILTQTRDGETRTLDDINRFGIGIAPVALSAYEGLGGATETVTFTNLVGTNLALEADGSGPGADIVKGATRVGGFDQLGEWNVTDIGGGYSKITSTASGAALTTLGFDSGADIALRDYTATDEQIWKLIDVGGGAVQLQNYGSFFRNISAPTTTEDAPAILANASTSNAQRWLVASADPYNGTVEFTNGEAGGEFRLEAVGLLDGDNVVKGNTPAGGDADLARWMITAVDSTYYKIENLASGFALAATGTMPLSNTVRQETFTEADLQLWSIEDAGSGLIEIKNKASGHSLESFGTVEDSNAKVFNDNDFSWQRWDLDFVGVETGRPVAFDDSRTIFKDTATAIDVLANDTDADPGATLSVDSVTQGENGTVTISGTDVVYTPGAGFLGTDTFTYTVTDGNSLFDIGNVTVTVNFEGTFRLTNQHTGFLDLEAASTMTGANVQKGLVQAGGDPELAQWTIIQVTDTQYRIVNVASGKDLTAEGTGNNANVKQSTFTGSTLQLWTIEETSTGIFEIANVASGRLLESFSPGGLEDANVQLFADNGDDPWQQWAFTVV